jgi:hypothetical protein
MSARILHVDLDAFFVEGHDIGDTAVLTKLAGEHLCQVYTRAFEVEAVALGVAAGHDQVVAADGVAAQPQEGAAAGAEQLVAFPGDQAGEAGDGVGGGEGLGRDGQPPGHQVGHLLALAVSNGIAP